jgi:hypothetical protein
MRRMIRPRRAAGKARMAGRNIHAFASCLSCARGRGAQRRRAPSPVGEKIYSKSIYYAHFVAMFGRAGKRVDTQWGGD